MEMNNLPSAKDATIDALKSQMEDLQYSHKVLIDDLKGMRNALKSKGLNPFTDVPVNEST